MQEKRVRVTIDNKGNFRFDALSGFVGTSCTEQTKNLELVLGGTMVDEGKTDAYYDGDGGNPVSIKI